MNVFTTFDPTKEQLSDMLASIKAGKTQLPDFQRGWVWMTSTSRACWRASLAHSRLAP